MRGAVVGGFLLAAACAEPSARAPRPERVVLAPDGRGFRLEESGRPFRPGLGVASRAGLGRVPLRGSPFQGSRGPVPRRDRPDVDRDASSGRPPSRPAAARDGGDVFHLRAPRRAQLGGGPHRLRGRARFLEPPPLPEGGRDPPDARSSGFDPARQTSSRRGVLPAALFRGHLARPRPGSGGSRGRVDRLLLGPPAGGDPGIGRPEGCSHGVLALLLSRGSRPPAVAVTVCPSAPREGPAPPARRRPSRSGASAQGPAPTGWSAGPAAGPGPPTTRRRPPR